MTKPIVIVSIVILLGLGYFAWKSNQVSNVNNPETEPQAEINNIVNDSSNNLDVKNDENKNKSEVYFLYVSIKNFYVSQFMVYLFCW